MTITDLQKFCHPDNPKVAQPFSRDGYTWATDDRVLLRVPQIEGVPDNPKAPDVDKVWQAEAFDVPMQPFETPLPVVTKTTEECDVCDGRGYLHDCPGCTCACEECDGEGIVTTNSDENQSIGIGDVQFALRYIRRMAALPSLRVPIAPLPDLPMPFLFDGGAGLLMPLRS